MKLKKTPKKSVFTALYRLLSCKCEVVPLYAKFSVKIFYYIVYERFYVESTTVYLPFSKPLPK